MFTACLTQQPRSLLSQAWIKSKNDASVSNDSDSEVEILKEKREIEIFKWRSNWWEEWKTCNGFKANFQVEKLIQSKSNQIHWKFWYRKGIGAWKGWLTLNLINVLKKPETIEDAYYHPNIEQMMKCRKAISKEFNEMKERKQFTRRFVIGVA
jgi:hypothetical protein